MKNKNIVKRLIDDSKTIGLVSHLRMDPDAYGCLLGLRDTLEMASKKVIIFSEEKLINYVKYVDPKIKYHPVSEYKKIDLIIIADTAHLERIAAPKVAENIKSIPGIVIDHHASAYKELPGYFYFVQTKASASELCYEFLKEIGYSPTQKSCDYFYMGLVSDSGDFKYSSVTKKTLKIADEIKEKAEKDIRKKLEFAAEKDLKNKEAFYRHCQKNAFKSNKYQAVITPITREELIKYKMEDSIGSQVANYIEQQLEDMASFVFMEMLSEDKIKVSMRSNKTGLNVRKIAEQYGGGGHDLAAGFSLSETLEESVKKFS